MNGCEILSPSPLEAGTHRAYGVACRYKFMVMIVHQRLSLTIKLTYFYDEGQNQTVYQEPASAVERGTQTGRKLVLTLEQTSQRGCGNQLFVICFRIK